MSILIGRDTRLVVQGITGREGEFHSRAMLEYGTNLVAGMTPGKGGQTALDGAVPVFNTVAEAVAETGANTSCIFVPAAGAPDAVLEAVAAGITTVFCITEGIPALDMVPVVEEVRLAGATLIGPNCPGATSPGRAKVGIIPGSIHAEGGVGVVSRSGTLTYEAVQAMTDAGLGQSTCVGIGGDPVIGTQFVDVLRLFADGPGDRGDRADRRDRRRGRGRGGRVRGRAPARDADGGIHRRPNRARGQAHGPRRRDRVGRAGHGRIEGRGARGGRDPRRRLPHRAAGAPPRGRLPGLMIDRDGLLFLNGYERWATTKILDAATGIDAAAWSKPNLVGERGIGGILVHHLGAYQRWRHFLSGSSGEPRPEDEPLLGVDELRARWVAEWDWVDAWLGRLTDEDLAPGARRHGDVAGAAPRLQPRHAASIRGRGAADGRRPVARRPRPDRLRRRTGEDRTLMAALMDLVAGDAREILLVLSVDDTAAFGDRSRFDAHLPLGAGLDPTWLDLFCEAARAVRNSDEPRNFLDARHELEGPEAQVEYTVEYVDAGWVAGVARLPDRDLDAITGRWIDLLEEDMGVLSAEEKPWIRLLASEVVRFCRAAGRSDAVFFAWSL